MAVFAQQGLQCLPAPFRHIADGAHARAPQAGGCHRSHPQQRFHRHGVQHILPVLPVQLGDRIRLFHIAAHFGKHLAKGDAHRDREPQLFFHRLADALGDLPVGAEQAVAARHVQIALIDAGRLHLVGKPAVDGVGLGGVFGIQLPVGRQQQQFRAFLFGLPNGLRRFDAPLLGQLVFGQDDPMPFLGVAAHGHGNLARLWMEQHLHRGVKPIHIHM